MTQLLFRSAKLCDLDAILQLAINSGNGLTTLPKSKSTLKERLTLSDDSFKRNINQPTHEYYLFVLEDLKTNKIVGTSAIESNTGYNTPFFTYKVSKRTRFSHHLNIRCEDKLLNLVNDHTGKSELCTLYLEPNYRHSHHGVFLSRARFIYMAQFPERFQKKIIAEMRGIINENGESPFWNHVGQHFFKMSFSQADELSLSTNKQFIDDLLPDDQIHVCLLDSAAQIVIGQPHEATKPAMNILIKEGFEYDNYVDIFDAGPTIEAAQRDIQTIKNSLILKVIAISQLDNHPIYIIGNKNTNFKATIGPLKIHQNGAIITQETSDLLHINKGDYLHCSPL